MDNIDFDEAEQLLQDPYACFKLVTSEKHITLLPKYINKTSAGIREQLNAELKLYSDSLDGALVAYNNVKQLSPHARIIENQPYLHLQIQAQFIIFQPSKHSKLKGIINKVSKNHIGCLVHKCFNAAVFKVKTGCYEESSDWSQFKLGDEIVFEVVSVYSQNGVVSIKGNLVQDMVKAKKQDNTTIHTQATMATPAQGQPMSNRQKKALKRKGIIVDEDFEPTPKKAKTDQLPHDRLSVGSNDSGIIVGNDQHDGAKASSSKADTQSGTNHVSLNPSVNSNNAEGDASSSNKSKKAKKRKKHKEKVSFDDRMDTSDAVDNANSAIDVSLASSQNVISSQNVVSSQNNSKSSVISSTPFRPDYIVPNTTLDISKIGAAGDAESTSKKHKKKKKQRESEANESGVSQKDIFDTVNSTVVELTAKKNKNSEKVNQKDIFQSDFVTEFNKESLKVDNSVNKSDTSIDVKSVGDDNSNKKHKKKKKKKERESDINVEKNTINDSVNEGGDASVEGSSKKKHKKKKSHKLKTQDVSMEY